MAIDTCDECGGALEETVCTRCGAEQSLRVAHHDLLMLVGLCCLALGVFIFTRFMAAQDVRTDDQIAASWFARGNQEMQAGEYNRAVDSFRKARARSREKREYVLGLSRALEAGGHDEEARQALLHLRESSPENAEINLYLARIATKRQDISEAVRYYHNALYGLWTGGNIDEQQRRVRQELVNFLLDHQQRSMALSELLVLETDVQPDAAAYSLIGSLFLRAGDAAHALRDFNRALRMDRNQVDALLGAGEAAFDLQDYQQARRYLQAAQALKSDPALKHNLLRLSTDILSRDPLANRLTREDRVRRMLDAFPQAMTSFESCLPRMQNERETADALHNEALSFQQRLKPTILQRDPELIREGVEMIYRLEHTTEGVCSPLQESDKALLLMAKKYAGESQ